MLIEKKTNIYFAIKLSLREISFVVCVHLLIYIYAPLRCKNDVQ